MKSIQGKKEMPTFIFEREKLLLRRHAGCDLDFASTYFFIFFHEWEKTRSWLPC